MSEKYRDCTKEWQKQQEALKNPKTIPIRVEEKSKKTPSAENQREN